MRGHAKGPLPIQKGPGRCASVGPCDPLAHKTGRQKPTKGGGQYAPAQRRSPWPSLGRGAGEIPYIHFGVITYSGFLDKVWPQNEKGKRKTRQKKRKKPLPPRVPRKGASEGASEQAQAPLVQGESQNRPGPRMAPRKNAKKRDARPKRAEQTKAAGHKKKKEQENRCVCGGVLLLPELYLLKKKKKQKQKPKTTTTTKKPKEERTNPEKTRPDKKRIFPNSFGSETPKNKAKT